MNAGLLEEELVRSFHSAPLSKGPAEGIGNHSMLLWSQAIILACAANIDSFLLGIALGLRRTSLRLSSNLIIASITGVSTILSASLGHFMERYSFSPALKALPGAILIFMGLWTIVSGVPRGRRCWASRSPATYSGREFEFRTTQTTSTLRWPSAVGLAAALSFNNFATGVPAGAAGVGPLLLGVLTGTLALVAMSMGIVLSIKRAHRLGSINAMALSALPLVLVGILLLPW